MQTAACRDAGIIDEDDVRQRLVPVLLGGDLLIYSYARELHRAYGIRSRVLCTADVKIVTSSRFVDADVVDGADREDRLVEELTRIGHELHDHGKVGLVMGSGDWYARTLSRHKEELSEWFVVPYNDFGLLDRVTQKDEFHRMCDAAGARHPETVLVDPNDESTLEKAASAFAFPVIAKPSNSAAWHYADFDGKRKIHVVETPDALRDLVGKLRDCGYTAKLLVQDRIPGADEVLRTVTLYMGDDGCLLRCYGRVVLQDHSPLALGNPVVIETNYDDGPKPWLDDAVRIMSGIGYHGYANLDVMHDTRDDTYRFLEVNTRPGRNTFYVSASGTNFVTPIVDDLVLGRRREYDATGHGLFACVPKRVVEEHVAEPLRSHIVGMWGDRHDPLRCPEDGAAHAFWASVTETHQIRKFNRYLAK